MKTIILLITLLNLLFATNKFIFEATIDKTNIYFGENFSVTYIFKSDKNLNIIERSFTPPEFENFSMIDKKEFDVIEDSNYNISKIKYTLTPNSDGNLTIQSALLDIATAKKKDIGTYRFEDTKYHTIESNPLNINIKKLPFNLTYIGDFTFNVKVDKTKLFANRPLNLTVDINGSGNFENIKPFKLQIDGTTIYSNNPIITKESFSQTFAILATHDYTIKPLIFSYFSKSKLKKNELKSSSYHVKIKQEQLHVIKNTKSNYLLIFLSFIVGVIGTFLVLKLKKNKVYDLNKPLFEKLNEAKDIKNILNILLPYSTNSNILNIIKDIDNSIYINQDYKITKKEIISRVKIIFTND